MAWYLFQHRDNFTFTFILDNFSCFRRRREFSVVKRFMFIVKDKAVLVFNQAPRREDMWGMRYSPTQS
jgi:hypothetical protein